MAAEHLTTICGKSVTTMANSGRKINYSLRPQKCVERKIICDLLSKCETTVPIHSYRYIGFGSFYFTDFVLFHNQLNIDHMISIERSQLKERFDFNKPYGCIKMCYADANAALSSKIEFSDGVKDVVWLDFDGAFQNNMLLDLMTAIRKVSSGSFLFTSFNISILDDVNEDDRLGFLKEEFGDYLPQLQEKDIDLQSLPQIIYDTIKTALEKALYERNTSAAVELNLLPFFFLKYKDDAPMLTIGYFLATDDEIHNIECSKASQLPWFNTTSTPSVITLPCLTKAEIREINRLIPGKDAEQVHEQIQYLSVRDIRNYMNLYKYYPNFLEAPFYT